MRSKKFYISVFALLPLFVACAFFLQHSFYKPKVFDAFLFFNEFDVLDIRLNELYEKVDKFILVESTKSFSNKEKPLYFLENKARYAKFLDKIVHVVVDEFPEFPPVTGTDYWHIENFQRKQIMQGLKRCKPNRRDIVIVTDVDEIIKAAKINEIVKLIDQENNDIVFGEFELYKFFVNRKGHESYQISLATSWGTLSKYVRHTQSFRNLGGFVKGHAFNGFEVLEAVKKRHPNKKWAFARIHDVGWHFTSLGSFARHLQKIANYSHLTADSAENRDLANIKNQINSLELCEVTERFPKYIFLNKDNTEFQNLIDQQTTTFQ